MRRHFSTLLLSVTLTLTACIHTKSRELIYLDLGKADKLGSSAPATPTPSGLVISRLIYTQDKLPLEDFFRRLKNGEFREAIGDVNLGESGNTDNRLLRYLLDHGLVPVYVRIRNDGSVPQRLSETDFYLDAGKQHVRAMARESVPREFEKFHTEALAANVINVTTTIIVGVAVVLVLASALGNCHNCGDLFNGIDGSGRGSAGSSDSMINKTTFTTQIGYREHLLGPMLLEPGATVEGVLFFRMDPAGARNYELRFEQGMYSPP